MNKLKQLQAKKSEGETARGAGDPPPTKVKKTARASAAEMRAQKDVAEMDPIPGVSVDFPDPDNLMCFTATIKPQEGLYQGAAFVFTLTVPNTYPFDPPKVLCDTPIYHPNIDTEGKVCLNILRADWMPVLSVSSVLFGLMTLFIDPNPGDPLNKEAANHMMDKPDDFERVVRSTLRGGSYKGRSYPRLV